jgi:hypothetical protein
MSTRVAQIKHCSGPIQTLLQDSYEFQTKTYYKVVIPKYNKNSKNTKTFETEFYYNDTFPTTRLMQNTLLTLWISTRLLTKY